MRKESAVVIGGSLAGLLAARVLADSVDQITIMEREVLVDEALPRQYVPQGYHGHALLTAGAQTISRLFPRILEELAADGAVTANIANGIWHHGGAPRVRYESQITSMGFTRPPSRQRSAWRCVPSRTTFPAPSSSSVSGPASSLHCSTKATRLPGARILRPDRGSYTRHD